MIPPTLDSLPTVALGQIARYLQLEYPPSLSSLALVNKACHAAATTWRLRNVSFKIVSRQKLRQDIQQFRGMVDRTRSLKHVRSLEIKGDMPRMLADEQYINDPAMNQGSLYDMEEILGESFYEVFLDDGPIEVLPDEDNAWAPIVELLQALPELKDLVFNSNNQFPPSLLVALQEYQPQCRLHLSKFRFRSLREDVMDTHEMEVATSSQLSSITVRWVLRDTKGIEDYNKEAVMHLIGGLAPNLETVHMKECMPVHSIELSSTRRMPCKPWRGFGNGFWVKILEDNNTIMPASLKSLTLTGPPYDPIKLEDFITWQKCTSFSTLQYLNLQAGISGETMQWAALNVLFPNLVDLTIGLDRDDKREDKPNFASSAVAFLTSIPPLEALTLYGSIDPEIFYCVVERHGKALRKLGLKPHESIVSRTRHNRPFVFTTEHISQIQSLCPLLEELEIPIKRCKGGPQEVEMYNGLGKMKQLTRIFLTLDCSDLSVLLDDRQIPNDPSFDEFLQDLWISCGPSNQHLPRKGHVRDALINSAIDEMLARSIWDAISFTKAGRPLKSLRLYPTGGGIFSSRIWFGDLEMMAKHLGRSYLLEKSPRDDDNSVIVRELGQHARKARDEHERLQEKMIWGDEYPSESASPGTPMEIFRYIWPPKRDSQDWRDDWNSMPLYI